MGLYKSSGGKGSFSIPSISFVARNSSAKIYGKLELDTTNFTGVKYTLSLSSATFTGSEYIRLYGITNGSSSIIQELGKTAGDYTITFDPTWNYDEITIVVFGHATADYGYVKMSNIEFS